MERCGNLIDRGNGTGAKLVNHDSCCVSYTNRNEEAAKVQFYQINLQHSRTATAELVRRFKGVQGVALVQEPWVKGNKVLGIGHLRQVCTSKSEHVRAAIVTDKKLRVWPMDGLSTADLAVAVIQHGMGMIVVASFYWDMNREVINNELLELINLCRTRKLPLLVGADTNAHSVMWGCDSTDSRGSILEDIIMVDNLSVLNTGRKCTFQTVRAKSIIDVTLINNLVQGIDNWMVDESDSMSDHKYIRYNTVLTEVNYTVSRRPFNKVAWDDFRTKLEEAELPQEIDETVEAIDEAASILTQTIWDQLVTVAPKCPPRRMRTKWWNGRLEHLRHRVRLANKKVSRSHTDEDIEVYSSLRKEYKYEIRAAKKQAWQEFVSGLESTRDTARVARALRQDKKTEVGILMKDGVTLVSPKETIGELMSVHLPNSIPIKRRIGKLPTHANKGNLEPPDIFTTEVVKRTLGALPKNKAPGDDGVPN